jgi:hypothetical protein
MTETIEKLGDPVSRRKFIALTGGSATAAAFLAACGDDDGGMTTTSGAAASSAATLEELGGKPVAEPKFDFPTTTPERQAAGAGRVRPGAGQG